MIRRMRGTLPWVASAAVAVVFLAPLLWMLLASFRQESEIFRLGAGDWFTRSGWTLQNYADGWRRAALGGGLLNSLLQVGLIAGVGLLVNAMAAELDRTVNVLFRITPGVDAHTHEYISTGQQDSKFGFDLSNGAAERARRSGTTPVVRRGSARSRGPTRGRPGAGGRGTRSSR